MLLLAGALAYLGLVLLLIVALLFGEGDACARTPLGFLNWLLLEGVCDAVGCAIVD